MTGREAHISQPEPLLTQAELRVHSDRLFDRVRDALYMNSSYRDSLARAILYGFTTGAVVSFSNPKLKSQYEVTLNKEYPGIAVDKTDGETGKESIFIGTDKGCAPRSKISYVLEPNNLGENERTAEETHENTASAVQKVEAFIKELEDSY